MVVKLAEGEPLPVDGLLLRMFSGVAEGLPADAAEWDVSGLRYKEDQPFSSSTVKAWLSCARCALHGPDELDAEDTALLSTAEGLHAVLSFAHAVDSPAGLLTAACSQLAQLKVVVQLPEQQVEVEMLRQGMYWLADDDTATDAVESEELGFTSLAAEESIGKPCVSQQQCQELQQAVARQVGACLHVAHLLQLQPLVDVLHSFIFWAAGHQDGLLFGVLELVFTDAVFDTVLGSGTVSKEAYLNSVLTSPCSMAADTYGHAALFRRVGPLKIYEGDRLAFEAELLHSFGGCAAGDAVVVALSVPTGAPSRPTAAIVCKDTKIMLTLQAQLLFGYFVGDADDFDEIMSGNMG
jgi:hypothetical protein